MGLCVAWRACGTGEGGVSFPDIVPELKFQLAVRLFEIGELSLGKAAVLADMAKMRFMDELGRLKIPVINLDEKEIQAEIRASRGDYHRG